MIRAIAMAAMVWVGLITIVVAGRHDQVTPAKPHDNVQVRDTALARCRAIGEGAARDPACQAAWAKARARFFGKEAS